jgi:RNA polymerase sigma-70 factor (ECF subfamily)
MSLGLAVHEPGVTVGPARASAVPTFDVVYAAQVDFTWRMLERLGVPTPQLEDAVQDVFIVVHRQLARFRSESSLKTWVGGIAVRVAHDYRRAAFRKGEHLGLDEAMHVADRHSTPFELASASTTCTAPPSCSRSSRNSRRPTSRR